MTIYLAKATGLEAKDMDSDGILLDKVAEAVGADSAADIRSPRSLFRR